MPERDVLSNLLNTPIIKELLILTAEKQIVHDQKSKTSNEKVID